MFAPFCLIRDSNSVENGIKCVKVKFDQKYN